MHDAVQIGLPLLVIVAGILFNRSDAKQTRRELTDELRSVKAQFHMDLKELRTDVMARLAVIEGDSRHFYTITGKLDGRVDTIEKRVR